MADTFALSATKRIITKHSARDTRAAGQVPGVVYGHGVDPQTISVGYSDLLKTYRKAGTSSIIDLDIEGNKVKVLVQALDVHPVRETMQHIDFLVLNLKEKTTVSVPLVFTGESSAVKHQGGTFIVSHEHIDLRCLPTDIPHEISIDISSLEQLHDHISIKDLGLDLEKLEVLHMDEETVLCSVTGRSSATDEDESTTEGEEGEASETEEAASEEG